MKPILTNLLIIILITACKKEQTSTVPAMDKIDTVTALVKYSGVFMNGPHGATEGKMKIYLDSGRYSLALVDMKIENGPDLHVYISKEDFPETFIDLGRLKSVSGNQVYPLSDLPDSSYKFVMIHCQQYNHLFGTAPIMPEK